MSADEKNMKTPKAVAIVIAMLSAKDSVDSR